MGRNGPRAKGRRAAPAAETARGRRRRAHGPRTVNEPGTVVAMPRAHVAPEALRPPTRDVKEPDRVMGAPPPRHRARASGAPVPPAKVEAERSWREGRPRAEGAREAPRDGSPPTAHDPVVAGGSDVGVYSVGARRVRSAPHASLDLGEVDSARPWPVDLGGVDSTRRTVKGRPESVDRPTRSGGRFRRLD